MLKPLLTSHQTHSMRPCHILLALLLFSASAARAASTYALSFDGGNDYVTMGPAPGLGGGKFTIECWFKRSGAGVSVSTDAAGVTAIPLITKGRSEADGDNRDMNYFLGIRATAPPVLVADFEEGATGPGINHPIIGVTPIVNDVWYHAAAGYDGVTFRLFLNGVLENTLTVGTAQNPRPARSDSIQHAAIGSALDSSGTAAGFFHGIIDEVRIWDWQRTASEISKNQNLEVDRSARLVGHFALDDGANTIAVNDSGTGINGTLMPSANPPTWVSGYQTLYVAGSQPAPAEPPVDHGLDLRGTDFIHFGNARPLALTRFTLELWFRREGAGTPTSGTIPLISKGRDVVETPANRNFNYIFGIRNSDNVLFADFEESGGANHPVAGATPILNNVWYHAAATFDGTMWRLYLNGALDGSASMSSVNPNSGSIQHAAVGAALDSDGSRQGGFDGKVDQVRIWRVARTQDEVVNGVNNVNGIWSPTSPDPDLAAAWGLDGGTGSSAVDVNRRITGNICNNTIGTPVTDRWVQLNRPSSTLDWPANNAIGITHFPTLKTTVADADSSSLTVTFYGRLRYANTPPEFTIVLIPDTQHYVDNPNNQYIYGTQTGWIVDNRNNLDAGQGVVFVSHLGDIVENRDELPGGAPNTAEWEVADWAHYILDANNVPNNLTVGNHDITEDGTADLFDAYFPPSRYQGFSWYGGWMGKVPPEIDRKNKNNYELFELGQPDPHSPGPPLKFIILHLEMDVPDAALNWAASILNQYADRRAIITTHAFINASARRATAPAWRNTDNPNSPQEIWDQLVRNHRNVFLVVNGHYAGEASRIDFNDWGEPVIQLCQDYQDLANGGDGWLRYLVFKPAENKIHAYTYSPIREEYDRGGESQFVLDYDMQGERFDDISVHANVAPSQVSSAIWTIFDKTKKYYGMRPYEWFVEVRDELNAVRSAKYRFDSRGDTFAYLHMEDTQNPGAAGLAVNNTKKVVGVSGTTPSKAVSWQVNYPSSVESVNPTLLNVPVGFTQTSGTGIGVNKAVGNGTDLGSLRAFYSQGASVGSLPPSSSPVYAYAVNNHLTAPTAVGSARVVHNGNNKMHACSWNLSGVPALTDLVLNTSLAANDSAAYDVNDLATPQIAGEVNTGIQQPAVWRNGAGMPTWLPFPGTDNRGTARGINDNQKIVGWTWEASQGVPRAVRWDYSGGVYTAVVLDLPATLPANSPSYALKINNRDIIVGYAYDSSGSATGYGWPASNIAIVWVSGTPHFVFDFIPPDYSLFFYTAEDINDSMDIVGAATYGGIGYMMSR